jgi:high-affinity iron transporter
MLQTFLTGLREGLEAAIVVSILVAFLVRSDARSKLPAVWLGVGLAVSISLAFGAVLTFTSQALTFQAQETFGGVMSIIAVGFVTWMVFWMRSQSHKLKGDLQHKMGDALAMGTGAVAVAAFIAVAREGLETALFLWPTLKSQGNGIGPGAGAVLGLTTAVVIGVLFYRGSIKMNLAKFFRITGACLIVIAAGVLAYGFHDLQEAGHIGGLNNLAFDVSGTIQPTSVLGTLLKGTINFSPRTTWVEAIVWVAYLVPTMALFLRPVRRQDVGPATPAATTDQPVAVN